MTAFELQESGVDTTLICDNMSAMVMKNGWVNAVFVGCDRVAANGDTANKIGTSVVAAVAKQYNVPVYICAPTSTIDMATATGDDIVIEERKPEEIAEMWYEKRMAPENVKIFNPAFDVTDHELIAGIVTEYGVARTPYTESLKAIMDNKQKTRIKGRKLVLWQKKRKDALVHLLVQKKVVPAVHQQTKNPFEVETNPNARIKHVIGIVSGKGGVGKSFVTSSLASMMAKIWI